MSEEEFDELLDLMSENNLTQHGADTLYGEIVDREIERKRLNNIINELEKYIVIKLKEYNTPEEFYTLKQIDDIHYKLQELKGSESNEFG